MTTPIGIVIGLDGVQQTEAGLRRVVGGVDAVGISAKQTAAALRGVPAQFTDIITSLQGGQAPLTVFLQQGGQLKDMFGGAGNAARALGGYVLGLVNPFTVAAAAGVALAVAYNQGSQEADKYTKSIALTGNAAGVTTAQLQGMAERVADVVGTQAKAADVLAQLVGTGNVVKAALEQQAATAIRLERNVGIAVKDTVKEFAELGKEPVEAAKKLNERYNFLTAAVYEQIKALKDQGKTQEAVALSQATYEKAMSTVADTLEGKLGYLERAWRAVGDGAAFAWDKMLNVGRGGTAADATAQVRDRLTRQQQELADKRAINPNADTSGMEKGIEVLKQRLGVMESDERMLRRGADAQALRTQAEKDGIAAAEALQKVQGKGLTQQQQMNKALEDYRRQVADLRAVNPNSERLTPTAIAQGERAIRQQFTPKGSGAASGGENEVAALRAQADAAEKYLEQLRATGAEVEKLTAGEQRAAKIREELKTSITGTARAQKELALVEAERLGTAERGAVKQKALIKSIEESEAAYRKVLDAITKTGDAYGTQADQQEAANASLGRSKTAIEEAALAQQKLYLANEKAAGPWDPARIKAMEYAIDQQNRYVEALRGGDGKALNARADELLRSAQELSALYADESQLVGLSNLERTKTIALRQVELKYAKELAEIEKASEATDEARTAKQLARDKVLQAKRIEGEAVVSKAIQDDWARTTDEINRSLTDALLRGFESGKGFAENLRDTLKNMFNTLVLRPIISAIMAPVSGAIGSLLGTGGGGAAGASGGGGLLNMLSMGKNAYSLYNGGLSGLTAPGSMYYNLATSGVGQGLGLSNAAPILGNNVSAFAPAGTQLTSPFSGGMSAAGGAGVFAAVVGVVLNALGAFKSERKIGSGLMGTLGKGDLQPWEEWREGGTLFSGPSFSTMNPVQELAARRAQLQDLKDKGQGDTQQAATLQVIVDNLENLYGDLADQAAAQSKAIQTAYDGLRKNVGDMADVLGISSDAVRAFTTQLGGSDKGLNFDGLSAEEIQAKVTEALATANNELAQQILGKFVTTTTTGTRIVSENVGSQGEDQNIVYSEVEQTRTSTRYVASEYAREGEEAIDTLTRLATSLSTVNDVFETLGITLLDASLSGGDAASALADAFGGLERLVSVTQDYYQNFYSDDERKAQMQGRLDKQFAELGIATPKNRDEFRKLADDALEQVEVQRANRANLTQGLAGSALTVGKGGFTLADLNKLGIGASVADGPANPELEGKLNGFLSGLNALADKGLDPESMQTGIAALIDLNGEVLGIGKDANETAAAILGLSGTFAELNESAADAQARIERERAKAQDEAYSNFRRAIARDRDALNEQADALRTSINSTRSAVDLLRGSAADMYATVDSTAQMLAAQGMVYIEQALEGVRSGGKLSDYTGLSDAVSATRDGLDRGVYATDFERRRDTLVWAGQFKALADAGDMQLTVEERQLKGINDQLDALNKLDKRAEQLVNGTLELTETVDVYFDRLLAIMAPPDKGDTRPERLNSGNGEAVFGGSNPDRSTGGGGASSPYKRPVSLGTAGTGYQPVVDADEVAKLNTLAPDYHKYDGTGDGRGLMTSMIGSGATAKDLEALSGMYAADWIKFAESLGLSIPAYAGGGMHAGGLRVVGERGWEIEATGPARYWNQQQLGQAMASGGGASDALVQEVRLLREEVAALRGAADTTAKNTNGMNQMAEQFDKVTNSGNVMRNKAIA